MFQDGIHKKLPFPIGVAGIDDQRCLLNELTDSGELLLCIRFRLTDPDFWDDRQIFRPPNFLARVVARHVFRQVNIRLCLLQHVTEAPGHKIVTALNESIAASGCAQLAGNGFCYRRFFCDE
ncbi:hypothetical protein D3C84_857670 [compost metagenome]